MNLQPYDLEQLPLQLLIVKTDFMPENLTLNTFAQLTAETRNVIRQAQMRTAKVIHSEMLYAYLSVGRLIVEYEQGGADRAEYGKQTIQKLSEALTAEFGRGYGVRSLERMRKVYLVYGDRISTLPMSKSESGGADLSEAFQLPYTHYSTLAYLNDPNERSFYEIEAARGGWSVTQLRRQIGAGVYERLLLSDNATPEQLAEHGHIITDPTDAVRNPYILEFLGIDSGTDFKESDLEAAVIRRIEQFMLELGRGFLFAGRQKRISIAGADYYVDLVFYNRYLKCFVLIDLKTTKFYPEYVGQMQTYCRFFDENERDAGETSTVGIIVCLEGGHPELVHYAIPKDSNIYAADYQLKLPDKDELMRQIRIAENSLRADEDEAD